MKKAEVANGTWVTMITPFTADNGIDVQGVQALVDWYLTHGVDGIFAVCQSSEMFYLSLRERVALAKLVLQQAKGRAPVVASGHVAESIQDQIYELAAMAELSPDVVVLVSNRLARPWEPDDVWKANAEKILNALPGVVFGIYECPYPYKRLMSPELLTWCAQTGRFAFLKDTCCDVGQIKKKLAAVQGSGLKIFNANSATLLESLKAGCSGFCGVMLNFHPALYEWMCLHWREYPQEAERLQHFATVASLIEPQMYPVNAKYHMALEGLPIGIHSRAYDDACFDALKKTATEHLYRMWKEFQMPAPLCNPLARQNAHQKMVGG